MFVSVSVSVSDVSVSDVSVSVSDVSVLDWAVSEVLVFSGSASLLLQAPTVNTIIATIVIAVRCTVSPKLNHGFDIIARKKGVIGLDRKRLDIVRWPHI